MAKSIERCRGGGRALIPIALMLAFGVAPAAFAVSTKDHAFGPFGPEGSRLREQFWLLPGGDPNVPLRATVFRPTDLAIPEMTSSLTPAPQTARPLIIINHGTDDATRQAVSMPVFYWLSRWFVDRGYIVVLPQRRGHGATGGQLAEGGDTCARPDHTKAGQAAADDIEAALAFMIRQPFVDPTDVTLVGISSGGWASLALAARNPAGIRAVINFAGGRGAFAGGKANAICGRDKLIRSAGQFGATARVPTLWLYSSNDRYFGPDLASSMAGAWAANGGTAELKLLPPYSDDGHALADDRAGWRLWGQHVERFLGRLHAPREQQLETSSIKPHG